MSFARVLVADNHAVVREGLKALFNAQPDLRVIAEAADGARAVELAATLEPDVVIVEVALPRLSGAQVAAKLRETRRDRKVLVLTACEAAEAVRLLLESGARGYVLKCSPADQLLRAVRAVAAGGTYLDPAVAGHVVAGERPKSELSERELLVLRMLALGYGNKEIAVRLKLSVKTIETYKNRSMEKLKLASRVDVVRYAINCGWMTRSASDSFARALHSQVDGEGHSGPSTE